MRLPVKYALSALLCLSAADIPAQPSDMEYRAAVVANASTGKFAPYMIGSWNYGKVTGASGIWHDGRLMKRLDTDSRFSWGAGFEYLLGYGTSSDYDRYTDSDAWTTCARRQAPARIQQLYAEVKYRSVFLTAGMKERPSAGIVDDALSSGDITRSTNARPIPGITAGFVDFQNIPFTNGWLQINGEIMYGRFTDGNYRRETFNHWMGVLSYDNWYIYRNCHFRTNPDKPLSVTVGMQAAGEFAGLARTYRFGEVIIEDNRGFHFRDIFDIFLPQEGSGESYYKGNSLGSWDLKARYRFRNGNELTLYFEGPWEDGSGIGRKNGWDGLWGLQFNFSRKGIISKAVVEYFDFTNQSGPLHWAAVDNQGSDMNLDLTGGDNYYNNDFYGPYSNYGMSIGSPFVVSPLYNVNGSPGYIHNRARGFHAAAEGFFSDAWRYKAMVSYQKAGGSGRIPAPRLLHDTSAMLEVQWSPETVSGLSVMTRMAVDAGNLRGNNFGASVVVSYTGSFNFKR